MHVYITIFSYLNVYNWVSTYNNSYFDMKRTCV